MNKIKRTYVKHMTIESKGTYVQTLMDTYAALRQGPPVGVYSRLDVSRSVSTILSAFNKI